MPRRLAAFRPRLLHFFENLLDVAHLVRYRHTNLGLPDANARFLNARDTPNASEVDILKLITCHKVIRRSECRFHDTAGCSKNRACASVRPQGAIGFRFRQIQKIDTSLLDHSRKFTRRNGDVDILEARSIHCIVAV